MGVRCNTQANCVISSRGNRMIRKCYLLNEQGNRRWILDLVGWLLAWCGQRDVYLPNVRTERTTNILVLERAGIVGVNVVLTNNLCIR